MIVAEAEQGSDARTVVNRELAGKRHGEDIAALLRLL